MNRQFILPLLLLPYWVVAAQGSAINFTTNPTEAQSRAMREGKLYFVNVTATWCIPCQWMEEHTFVNETLVDFVEDHYLAVQIDFDDPNATIYKKRFRITALPSLLVFNEKGELLDRYETSLSKEELLLVLQKNNSSASRIPSKIALPAVDYKTNRIEPGSISRPALIPDELSEATEEASLEKISAQQGTAFSKPSAQAKPSALHVGFSLQVGVFSDVANAERTVTRMQQQFNQPVKIVEIEQKEKRLYKVMLGKFERKEDAASFLQKLTNLDIKGYVKSLAD